MPRQANQRCAFALKTADQRPTCAQKPHPKNLAPLPNCQHAPREIPKHGGKSPKAEGCKREVRRSKTPSQERSKAKNLLKNPKTPRKIMVGSKKENRRFFVKIPNRKGKGKRQSKCPFGVPFPKGICLSYSRIAATSSVRACTCCLGSPLTSKYVLAAVSFPKR